MYNLLVKYDLEHDGKKYKSGNIIKSDDKVEIDSLTRRGCIFVEEKAECREEVKVVEAPVEEKSIEEKPEKKSKKKVRKDVTNKDTEQAKVQTEYSVQE